MTLEVRPEKGDTPLTFVERADTLGASFKTVDHILRSHFGMSDAREIKTLKLKSSVFWEKFYRERALGIFERGGTRYAAMKFIERKNGQSGQKVLTDDEIIELVDSVGNWTR